MMAIKQRIQKFVIFLAALLFLQVTGSARASINMYLSITDSSGAIPGEVTNTGFSGQILVTNFSWSVANPTVDAIRGGSGPPVFNALTITKFLDLASPVLMEHCAAAIPFTSAVLSFQSQLGKQKVFYTITLSNGFITGVNSSGSSPDGQPLETITLNYAQIAWQYQQLDANGDPVGQPVTHDFNLKTNIGS